MIANRCSGSVSAAILAASALALAGCAASTSAMAQTAVTPPVECPAPLSAVAPLAEHFDGYRVFTGPDGDSAVEPLRIDAKQVALPYNGRTINIFNLPLPSTRAPSIVIGPADMELPMHPAPYKEMFVLLAGSFTLKTKTFTAEMKPGSVVLFDDADARFGHGGTIGPCGYVSLSIAP